MDVSKQMGAFLLHKKLIWVSVVFFYVFALLCCLLNCFQLMDLGRLVDFLIVLCDSGWYGCDQAGFFLYLGRCESTAYTI